MQKQRERSPSPTKYKPVSPSHIIPQAASPKPPSPKPPTPVAPQLAPVLHIKVLHATFHPKIKHSRILTPYVLFLTPSGDPYQTRSMQVLDGIASWDETLNLPDPIGGETLDLACYDETTEEHIGEAVDISIS